MLRHHARLCVLEVLSCAALAGPALSQTTWYIDANATPPGNGTLASPYADIQYAIDQPTTVKGNLLLVAAGTYFGPVKLDKDVTLRSIAGPLTTVIQATGPQFVVTMGKDGFFDISPDLEGFSIVGNATSKGIFLNGGFVRRCIVRDHKAGSFSGVGIDAPDISAPVGVIQCTIVNNNVGAMGPSIGIIPIDSSIAYGNSTEDLISMQPTYCLWGNGSQAFGSNLKGDPRLWDLPTSDVHLGPLSPCIDVGNPNLPLDPDGSRADMGALPFSASYLPTIATYCTGKVNSQGCAASVGASGGANASMTSPAPFLVTCNGVVEGVPGLLFWGHAPRAVPFMGGFHCVQPPTPRTGGQLAGTTGSPCSGSFSFDFNAYAQSGIAPSLAAGQVIRAQYWYRDPSDPAGFGAATSDALEFALAP